MAYETNSQDEDLLNPVVLIHRVKDQLDCFKPEKHQWCVTKFPLEAAEYASALGVKRQSAQGRRHMLDCKWRDERMTVGCHSGLWIFWSSLVQVRSKLGSICWGPPYLKRACHSRCLQQLLISSTSIPSTDLLASLQLKFLSLSYYCLNGKQDKQRICYHAS